MHNILTNHSSEGAEVTLPLAIFSTNINGTLGILVICLLFLVIHLFTQALITNPRIENHLRTAIAILLSPDIAQSQE